MLPMGTDIREKARELVNKRGDIEQEIQELRGQLLHARNQKQEVDFSLVTIFVEADYYWLVKVDETALRKFIMED